MSLKSLVSGSECALPSNPLSQVLKHTEGDRTLQQDRIAGPSSSSRLHHLPGTSFTPGNEHDLALARQFFQNDVSNFAPGPTFQRPDMRPGISSPGMLEAWTLQQQPQKAQEMPPAWAMEFGGPQHTIPTGPATPQVLPNTITSQGPSYMNHSNVYSTSMSGLTPFGSYMPMAYSGFQGMAQPDFKGKGKEIDFDAAFAQMAESMKQEQENTSRIVEVADGVEDIDAALKNTTLADVQDTSTEFRRFWNEMRGDDVAPPEEDMVKWEAEFNQMMNSQREEDFDYETTMKNAWESGIGDYENFEAKNQLRFNGDGSPILDNYVFETENPFMDPSASNSSPLNDAKALLDRNGSLSEAALLLEAAIQKGDLGEGGYEAWILLGETRNMDEREEAGMRALMQGVKIAEDAGAAGAGMLSLAISFTNESYDRASYSTLLRWFRARFPDVPVSQETINAVASNATWDSHGRVTDLFMNLARNQHSKGVVDPDVQVALGILFYTNSEYDRARDCFESALSVHPKDYLLWNRLGSSLSNGSKPEEALTAYREALQLRPTYTRAIYNVGVACLNIGAHKEAAEHFLSALALQESSGGTSDQLWFTLRRAFMSMEREDLAELTRPENRVSLDVFRKEGFDF